MPTRSLAVVSAGLRKPSSTRLLADRLADASRAALERRGDEVRVDVVELREHAHDLTNNLLTGFPGPDLRAMVDTVVGADGLIAVTPVFTASYSGLFKSFFDTLDADALTGKPVLVAATGGTERHSLVLEHAMRPLFAYLRALVVPTGVYAASSDWGEGGTVGDALISRIERAAGELATLMGGHGLPGRRDPFGDLTPFEQLLRGE